MVPDKPRKVEHFHFSFENHLILILCAGFNPNGTGVFLGQSEPGGGLISTPPCYLCPGASGRLVLNMTIVGYPLKIFLRYITFL